MGEMRFSLGGSHILVSILLILITSEKINLGIILNLGGLGIMIGWLRFLRIATAPFEEAN
ncbi:MAG: hypothetical protein ACOC38_03685 [Promethearchaeia archaeon]